MFEGLLHIAAEELDEERHVLLVLEPVDPRVNHRGPPDVLCVDVDDTAAGHGGGRAVHHVVDLQQQAHGRGERDALVGGQREHLVVVHHCVHGLDPLRVDVAVQNDPLVQVRLVVGHVAEVDGDEPLLPLPRARVQKPVELVAGHRLWVDGLEDGLLAEVVLCAKERLPDRRLAASRRTQEEHRPPHDEDLPQLRDLQAEDVLRLVLELNRRLLDLGLELGEDLAGHQVERLGEEIV
mmetsp:Transcript_27855/g.46608  ORF Transcript_27855/g.46608 Transcript_27855/m.46608 type:complete len:237 (+) Transcript_27855:4964-5674(+)